MALASSAVDTAAAAAGGKDSPGSRIGKDARVPLKTGMTAMALALVCAGAVAVFALFGGASEPAAAVKSSTEPGTEPLVRSDPGFEPWKEKAVTLTEADPEDSWVMGQVRDRDMVTLQTCSGPHW